MHVHFMATPRHENPCPGGHEIYNFGKLFFDNHYYNLSLYGLCPSEKKILKEIMHFHSRLIWPHPSTRITSLGVMKFTILVNPSLDIITIPSVCLIGAEKKIFKEIMCFHYITYMATP